jgi:hypothetical protein
VAVVPEHDPTAFEACALCGRTILRGERLWEHLTAAGERRGVCSLCRKRAAALGWMPAHLADEPLPEPRDAEPEPEPEPQPSRAQVFAHDHHEPVREEPVRELPAPVLRDERSLRERAVEVFNADPERGRTIAGISRSLGEPSVAIEEDVDETVTITVAWELSWYRWEVRAGGAGPGVRQVAKGAEIEEIVPSPRWNARAGADGRLETGEG